MSDKIKTVDVGFDEIGLDRGEEGAILDADDLLRELRQFLAVQYPNATISAQISRQGTSWYRLNGRRSDALEDVVGDWVSSLDENDDVWVV